MMAESFKEKLDELVPDQLGSPKNNISKIPLRTGKDGKPLKIRSNLTRVLRYYDDNLSGAFRYNEATDLIEIVEDRQLHSDTILRAGKLSDDSLKQVASYISEKYELDYSVDWVADEITVVAREKTYNPIKDFLKLSLTSKEADPFPIIQKYINIEDTEYNKIVLDLFFRGAIGRVLDAGCQFDYCLDLTGVQGAGKTTFLREMFKGYYSEVTNFYDKDQWGLMAESWLVNDDELVASSKTKFPELKQIITRRELKYRPAYGRGMKRVPVSFVFSRTTNDFEHLNDATGDRRFLPMRVLKKRKEQPNTISDKDRLTIWGNYYRSYLANPVLFYAEDSKEGKIIETEREKYKIVDDDIERLEWYLETKIPKDFYDPTTFPHQRKSYYYDLEQYGKAYKTSADKERGIEWESIVARTKVTTNAVMEELFSELSETQKAKARKKTRLYLNSNPRWEKKENVRLGFKVSSGWERATKKTYK